MKGLLVPRITESQARERLQEIQSTLTDLENADGSTLPLVDFPGAAPNPVGGQAATATHVQIWRQQLSGRLANLDTKGVTAGNAFSLNVGRCLHEVIQPIPSDASHNGVWWFLSLYVFPDLVFARWPGAKLDGQWQLPVDRWIGAPMHRDRNFLKSAWRRWDLFGDQLLAADPLLGEDEFLNLMERSAVARNHRLLKRSAQVIIETGRDNPIGGRSAFAREFMKLVAVQTGPYALELIPDQELDELLHQLRDEAKETLILRGA